MEHDKNGCTALLYGPGSTRCGRWFRQIRKGSTTYCLKRSPDPAQPGFLCNVHYLKMYHYCRKYHIVKPEKRQKKAVRAGWSALPHVVKL